MNGDIIHVDADMQLIGALCQRPAGLAEIDVLPEHMYTETARLALSTLFEMESAGHTIDPVSLSMAMGGKRNGQDFLRWCCESAQACLNPQHARSFARAVRTAHLLRQARAIGNTLAGSVNAQAADEAIDAAIQSLMALRQTKDRHEWSAHEAMRAALDVIKSRMDSPTGVCGLPSGLSDLDAITGGFQDTDLITVGARSGMGKTAFVLNLMMNCGQSVGLISSEQGYRQIGERLYAIAGRVNTSAMRTGRMDDEHYDRMCAAVSGRDWEQVRINDKPGINVVEVSRQAREWKHKHGIRALFVDYLQRIQPVDRKLPRREQIDEVVVGLKNIARELRIPVIALAQVNRSVEQRADPRPNMSDLKESGKIEEESDVILTLYREDYYKPETERKGIVEVDILKNRHGPTGVIDAVWRAEFLRFENMTHYA
jgi:replicative DNA helicase